SMPRRQARQSRRDTTVRYTSHSPRENDGFERVPVTAAEPLQVLTIAASATTIAGPFLTATTRTRAIRQHSPKNSNTGRIVKAITTFAAVAFTFAAAASAWPAQQIRPIRCFFFPGSFWSGKVSNAHLTARRRASIFNQLVPQPVGFILA